MTDSLLSNSVSELTAQNIPMHGLTCWKQALVRSPSRAKELWRTSGILSWTERKTKRSTMQMTLSVYQISGVFDSSSPACTGTWGWGCCYEQPTAQWCPPNPQPVHWEDPKPRSWSLCQGPRTGLAVTDEARRVKDGRKEDNSLIKLAWITSYEVVILVMKSALYPEYYISHPLC